MTGGGSVVDRIAAVQEKHADWWGWSGWAKAHARSCGCGEWFDADPSAQFSRASYSAHVAGEVAKALQLEEERREDVKKIPEGLDIVVEGRTGTSVRGWCNQCDYGTGGYVSPREAWDWAYAHAETQHGYTPARESRLVSPWAPVPQEGDR